MCRTCSGVLNASRVPSAAESVAQRRELGVVPPREAFELRPANPTRRKRAFVARGLQLRRGEHDFRPGLRRFLRIESRCFERVLVVVEHGRRAVKWQAQHLAVRRRVIAGDCGHVRRGIKLVARLFHQVVHWLNRTLRCHHRRGADFEHLQDVRRITGAKSGDCGRHRLVVAALKYRHDLVFLLALVESLG